MSAWMVSDAHIDLLATAYVALVDGTADPQRIGRQLLADNARSIRARYGDEQDPDAQVAAYRYRRWLGNMRPELLSKQIACLDYQSREFDEWPQSASRRYLDALQWHCPKYDAIARDIADALPWGIDEHPAAARRVGAGAVLGFELAS
ncbi:MAG TPA: hypothetical protein VGW34_10640 [Allosphingosinicella sp.]|nr:hypothetical protein [Allosphingosinicella sp.]